jgi:hypothetical protein
MSKKSNGIEKVEIYVSHIWKDQMKNDSLYGPQGSGKAQPPPLQSRNRLAFSEIPRRKIGGRRSEDSSEPADEDKKNKTKARRNTDDGNDDPTKPPKAVAPASESKLHPLWQLQKGLEKSRFAIHWHCEGYELQKLKYSMRGLLQIG